jgi:hypothetical protein
MKATRKVCLLLRDVGDARAEVRSLVFFCSFVLEPCWVCCCVGDHGEGAVEVGTRCVCARENRRLIPREQEATPSLPLPLL